MRSLPVWLLAFFLLTVPPSYAQESRATMEGRVTDQQGALVPGATVQVKSEATEVSQNAKTGDDGRWSVRFLNPGSYSLTISAPGFKTFGQRGITLEVADDKEIDATLEVGTKNEVVEVTSEPPLIDTTSATSGTVIEPKTISDLPMESRIPYQLAGLSPGVQPLDQNNNVAFMWSNNAASEIRINGGRDNKSNEFLLDGMPNQNRDRVAYVPPADAVSEFRVMTNNYDAQYGRQAGGTLNVSIKSGTSNYHGNMYLYHQNSSLNANLFQSNRAGSSKPVAHYYLYGGTIGGPVFLPLFGEGEPYFYDGRHKTFFFFTFEGIRNKDPRFGVRSVPTELERQGDFSQSYTTQLIGGQRVRVPLTIYDPQTVDTRGSPSTNSNYGARLPFLGNKIPDNRISPIAKNILAFIPLPNAPSDITGNASNNFVPHSTRQNKMASTLVRVDHTFNDRNKLFATVRWNHMDEFSGDDFSDVATGGLLTRINKAIGFDYVRTLSQTRILNLRYSLNRFEEPSKSNGAGFNPAQLGFSPDLVSKMERFSFPRITGVFGGIGGGFGSYNITTYHNLNANLTQVHGKMTFHYGTDTRFLQDARSLSVY